MTLYEGDYPDVITDQLALLALQAN